MKLFFFSVYEEKLASIHIVCTQVPRILEGVEGVEGEVHIL